MKSIRITIGLETNKNGESIKAKYGDTLAKEVIKDAGMKLAKLFGGYTVTFGEGGWINDKGDLVQEKVVILTACRAGGLVISQDIQEAKAIASQAGEYMDQACVLFEVIEGTSELVFA